MNPAYRRSVFIPLLRHIFAGQCSTLPLRALNDVQRRGLATATTEDFLSFIHDHLVEYAEYATGHPDAPKCILGLLPDVAHQGDTGACVPLADAPAADANVPTAAVDVPESASPLLTFVDGGTSPS